MRIRYLFIPTSSAPTENRLTFPHPSHRSAQGNLPKARMAEISAPCMRLLSVVTLDDFQGPQF